MHYVIIGNGVTGINAALTLRQRDDEAKITIISDESPYFFSRTALMWAYMGDLSRKSLEPYERWFWREKQLQLIQDTALEIINSKKTVQLKRTGEIPYDKLLLATGGDAFQLPLSGIDLQGVSNMCTLEDLNKLEAIRPRLKKAVVVGGGLIGIELVEMMVKSKVPVTYVVREPWYWDAALSQDEANLVHRDLKDHGVSLLLEDELVEIVGNEQKQVKQVKTRKGKLLDCDLLGLAIGVRPKTKLAEQSGIDCHRGILVDAFFRTSLPNVYAAGDCAELRLNPQGMTLNQRLWYTGIHQGHAAAKVMSGEMVPYQPNVPVNCAQFLHQDYLSVGWMNRTPFPPPAYLLGKDLWQSSWTPAEPIGVDEAVFQDERSSSSIRIAFELKKEAVLGFSMLGQRWKAGPLIAWIKQRRRFSWVVRHLSEANFNEEFKKNPLTKGLLNA